MDPAPAARPRGTLARCLFAWVSGTAVIVSVGTVGASWALGALSARGVAVPDPALELAWSAYIAGWVGTLVSTPAAAVAAAVAGGKPGRTAAVSGGLWVLLLTLQSVVFAIADLGRAQAWLEPAYAISAVLVMGIVPLAIAVSTLLAGAWRWQAPAA